MRKMRETEIDRKGREKMRDGEIRKRRGGKSAEREREMERKERDAREWIRGPGSTGPT